MSRIDEEAIRRIIVLSLAPEVRGADEERARAAEGPRAGERAAQEARRRADARQPDPPGRAVKERLRPGRRREHVQRIVARHRVSERKACRALGWPRSSHRYRGRRRDQTPRRLRMKELALARPRYGYRRLHVLLRREGWMVNPKRVLRLYREEGLTLRSPRKKRKYASWVRVPLPRPLGPNEQWTQALLRHGRDEPVEYVLCQPTGLLVSGHRRLRRLRPSSSTRSPDPPAAGAPTGSSGRGPWRS
jgi:hypothetical protein